MRQWYMRRYVWWKWWPHKALHRAVRARGWRYKLVSKLALWVVAIWNGKLLAWHGIGCGKVCKARHASTVWRWARRWGSVVVGR